jgi:hypothetical protein
MAETKEAEFNLDRNVSDNINKKKELKYNGNTNKAFQ